MQKAQRQERAEIVKSILRMSQKAMGWTLAMIGLGFVGGCVAICIRPELSQPISEYVQVFVPVFVTEIGMYGLGSTLENVQKVRAQVDGITGKKEVENG